MSQSQFTKGTDPQVTNGDYSNAFKQVEAYEFNTICVDTEDTSVHLLLQSFINRIFDAASLTQAVVAEKHTVDLETREELQARCNLTELQAVNIINGFHIPDYVRIAEVRAAKEAEEHEN